MHNCGVRVVTVHDLIYYGHRTPPAEFAWWVRLLWRIAYLSYLPRALIAMDPGYAHLAVLDPRADDQVVRGGNRKVTSADPDTTLGHVDVWADPSTGTQSHAGSGVIAGVR